MVDLEGDNLFGTMLVNVRVASNPCFEGLSQTNEEIFKRHALQTRLCKGNKADTFSNAIA